MQEILIPDEALAPLQNKVVVVIGCTSGIGLGAVNILLNVGAKVFGADRGDKPAIDSEDFEFAKADVTSWEELRSFFDAVIKKHGHMDHVFANAGVTSAITLLEDDLDADGNLKAPNMSCFNINFFGMVNMVKLAIHHIKKSGGESGSVVMTASASSYQRLAPVDYTSAKHGVLGLMRALHSRIGPNTSIPVRINAIAPSWTLSGLLPVEVAKAANLRAQTGEDAARSALLLMADASRHGQLIYSVQGKYAEFEEPMIDSIEKMISSAPSIDPRIHSEPEEYWIVHNLMQAHRSKNKK